MFFGNVFNIPLVSIRKALPQGNPWLPAHSSQARNIEEFLRYAIGFFGGVAELTGIAHYVGHRRCQLGDSQVLAPADVDLLLSGIILHQKYQCIGKVVDVQEFPPWPPAAPNLDIGSTPYLCPMDLNEQRGCNVATEKIIISSSKVR